MSDSPAPPIARPHVLVTGAAGRIGRSFAAFAVDRYRLRLLVRPGEKNIDEIRGLGEIVEADLGDLPRMIEVMQGIDACVHLAGDAFPGATWDRLLPANVVGTYNTYAAAKAAGCRRVVYASSIHAVSGYPADTQVHVNDPVAPGDIYGVTKCFGEALARYMADHEGVTGVAIRIGAHNPVEKLTGDYGLSVADAWVSPRDLNQLISLAIDRADVTFAVVHGLSDNTFKRLNIDNARERLGYSPVDNAFAEHEKLRTAPVAEKRGRHSLADADDPQVSSGLRDTGHSPSGT